MKNELNEGVEECFVVGDIYHWEKDDIGHISIKPNNHQKLAQI